jgi:hypothetical protein
MYYKVVNSDFSSAYVGSDYAYSCEKLKVYYKIDDWVEPKIKGSKLMVFDSLENAQYFMDHCGWGVYIYKCEVKNPSKKGVFVKANYRLAERLFRIIDLKNKKKKFTDLLDEPIKGTIFCDAVKLVEKV